MELLECVVIMGFPGGSDGKETACNVGDRGLIPGLEDPLEEGMAVHFRFLHGESPWTQDPAGL